MTRDIAKRALESLKDRCKDDLSNSLQPLLGGAAGAPNTVFGALSAAAGTTYFYDANGPEGNLTQTQATGIALMGPQQTLSGMFASVQATYPGLAGLTLFSSGQTTNHVVLGGAYQAGTVSGNSVLLHELLHVVFRGATGPGNHQQIASHIGLGSFSSDTAASQAISDYFARCLE